MSVIHAVYRKGVFEPSNPVKLDEGAKVTIHIESGMDDVITWLDRATALRGELRSKYGDLPDSAVSIAEDRRRDG